MNSTIIIIVILALYNLALTVYVVASDTNRMKYKQYKKITDKNISDIEARLKESRKQSRILQTKVNNRELEINGLKDYIHRLEHLVNKIEHEQHKERQFNKRRSERA